jgi:hypothetical protein
MTNKQIVRHIQAQRESRDEWLRQLNKNPDNLLAAQHIVTINSKIHFLLDLWNWTDESVQYPHL